MRDCLIRLLTPAQLTTNHWQLLLEADPSITMIEKYVSQSELFEVLINEKLIGVMVVKCHETTDEIMNISVLKSYQGQGVATFMIQEVIKKAKKTGKQRLMIATGTTSFKQLALYQRLGFRVVAIRKDFFTTYYDEPLIENGIILKDMLCLEYRL